MAERTATNAPIQGTATADIIKLAIRYAEEDLKRSKIFRQSASRTFQIHDELVYEIEESVLEKAEKIIKMPCEGTAKIIYTL